MSQITRDQLMAYADGQLPEDERAAVEAHMAADPEAAADVALLHALLSDPLPAPEPAGEPQATSSR